MFMVRKSILYNSLYDKNGKNIYINDEILQNKCHREKFRDK